MQIGRHHSINRVKRTLAYAESFATGDNTKPFKTIRAARVWVACQKWLGRFSLTVKITSPN